MRTLETIIQPGSGRAGSLVPTVAPAGFQRSASPLGTTSTIDRTARTSG